MNFSENLSSINSHIGIKKGVVFKLGIWTVGLLRIPKKCEGGAKGDAKEVAKEVAWPPSLFNLT